MCGVCVCARDRDGETERGRDTGLHVPELGRWLQWNCDPLILPARSGSTGGDGIPDKISSKQREFFSMEKRWIYGPDHQDSKV